jgi:hypothetical protein
MSVNASDTGFVPPYIAFKTILGLIERMEREEPPARIDKSYLDNLSGGYRTQVLAALHSLDLVQEEGALSGVLKSLVQAAEPERKKILAEVIRDHYGVVLALTQNATQQQMIDAFTEMAPTVTGDTRRKAIAFFLSACQYAGIEVSRHWKTPRVPPSGKRGQTGRSTVTDDDEPEDDDTLSAAKPNTRELALRSGGVVTLTLSVDLFSLAGEDRDFVFHLIDKMSTYENQRQLPAGVPMLGANGADEN